MIRGRGAPRPDADRFGSTIVACLVTGFALASTPRGSTLPRTWWRRGCRSRRRPGCWRAGSGARCGRPAAMPGRRPGRAGRGAPGHGGVHGQAARGAGREGTRARPPGRAQHLRGGHPGAGGLSREGSAESSPAGAVRRVEAEFVFDRHAATDLSVAYGILVPPRRARIARAGQEGQPDDDCGALRPGLQQAAGQRPDDRLADRGAARPRRGRRLEVPEGWVFEDEGHSGATLVRPALEALRDLAARGCIDVVLVYSPYRLAGKFAYQALLIEEFTRAGVRVEFIKNGTRGDSPEDQLLVQFQGMFAEYEKAQLMERYRRGKAYRARSGQRERARRRPVRLPLHPHVPPSPPPATRSPPTRRCWWRRCSAATPMTAPPSRTWPAGWPPPAR